MRRTGVVLALLGLLVTTPAWGGVGKLDLAWTDNATNEDGFAVESHTGACVAGATFAEIGRTAVNVMTFSNTGLGNGVTMCYRVRAFNAAGLSGYTNEAAGTTLPVPNAPTNLLISFLRALGLDAIEDWLFPTPKVSLSG